MDKYYKYMRECYRNIICIQAKHFSIYYFIWYINTAILYLVVFWLYSEVVDTVTNLR